MRHNLSQEGDRTQGTIDNTNAAATGIGKRLGGHQRVDLLGVDIGGFVVTFDPTHLKGAPPKVENKAMLFRGSKPTRHTGVHMQWVY